MQVGQCERVFGLEVDVAWSPAIAAYVHTLVCAGHHRRAIDEGEGAILRARADGLAELWVCGRIEPQLAIARARLAEDPSGDPTERLRMKASATT